MAFLIGLLVAIFAFHADLPVVISQSLTSTLESGFACLGSRVTFTCETRGSDGIAWTSNTYVGPGGVQIVFVAGFSSPGERRTSLSNADTVATFIEEREEQGVTVLKSTLAITPLPDPQNASVTCVHTADVERSSMTFQVIDVPTTPENVVPVQIEHYGGYCVIHTVWNSPNHNGATRYEVSANRTRMLDANTTVIETNNGTRISALFPISCAAYEIGVIATNPCGMTSEVFEFTPQRPLHFIDEPEPTAQSTSPNGATQVSTGAATATDRESVPQSCESYWGALIGVSLFLGLLCIVLFAIMMVLVGKIFYLKKSNSDKVNLDQCANEETKDRDVQL